MDIDTDWKLHGNSAVFIEGILDDLSRSEPIKGISQLLWTRTSTRLLDWIDHIRIGEGMRDADDILNSGFELSGNTPYGKLYTCPGSILPGIVHGGKKSGLWLMAEDLDRFLYRVGSSSKIHGVRYSALRTSLVREENGIQLGAIERRGDSGFEPDHNDDQSQYQELLGKLKNRDRETTEDTAFGDLQDILNHGVSSMGAHRTADAFFDSERRFWEKRNMAGRIQLDRQDMAGLGWGNHDHHTFRCSRKNFKRTISLLELIGMEPRERFYAGDQAGWGAQVMEQKECGIAVFADVDLDPEEKDGDFAHSGLGERDELGTVGLWTALHGESILSAGLHHLASRVSFSKMMLDSKQAGIKPMSPFSNFPYLKQCFTEGERWKVLQERGHVLLEEKRITGDQFKRFIEKGALGSHLELIERGQGYKGFNQEAVSDIIERTDPRRTE